MEIFEGSYGGRHGMDGMDAVDTLYANTRNNPIEDIESACGRTMFWPERGSAPGESRSHLLSSTAYGVDGCRTGWLYVAIEPRGGDPLGCCSHATVTQRSGAGFGERPCAETRQERFVHIRISAT